MTQRLMSASVVAVAAVSVFASVSGIAYAQEPRYAAEAAQLLKTDAEFAQSVAEHDRQRFLSFIADVTTFNGGLASELRGRDAVMKAWSEFFEPDGPTLSWTPTTSLVVGAGDLGYTTGHSLQKARTADGTTTERSGEYLTVWRKQRDGSWKVVFDTGSTLPVR